MTEEKFAQRILGRHKAWMLCGLGGGEGHWLHRAGFLSCCLLPLLGVLCSYWQASPNGKDYGESSQTPPPSSPTKASEAVSLGKNTLKEGFCRAGCHAIPSMTSLG